MARMGSERQLWLSILPAVDGTARNSRGDRAADMPNLSQPRGKRPQSAPRRRHGRSLPRFGVGGISFALVAHLSTAKVVRAELKVLVGTSGWVESGRMSAKAGFSGSAAPTISPPGCK